MGIATRAIPPTTGNLPARARSGLHRLDPMLAFQAVGGGAIVINTRPEWQRRADGDIPGAIVPDLACRRTASGCTWTTKQAAAATASAITVWTDIPGA